MSHTSPSVSLVWGILSFFLFGFLLSHLWRYDRFKCLKWNTGANSGAFKRFMTYSYLISIPLLLVWCIGFAVIKYDQGFMFVPGQGIIPKPYSLWPEKFQRLVLPLTLCFSFAWALELVTHLEELCFWLFLLGSGPVQPSWFHSTYFYVWLAGSLSAIAYMPVVTIITRSDVYVCEAWTLLAGASGSLLITIGFLPILWNFRGFLNTIVKEGVEERVINRLSKFHELNSIRIVFRFIMVIPLFVLGVDGVRPHRHINENMFWTDCLAMFAGVGCVVSSSITLMIFFPRIAGQSSGQTHDSPKQSGYSSQTARPPITPSARGRTVSVDSRRKPHPNSYSTASLAPSSSPTIEQNETPFTSLPPKRLVMAPPEPPIMLDDLSPSSPKYALGDLEMGMPRIPYAAARSRTGIPAGWDGPVSSDSQSWLPLDAERQQTINPLIYHYRSPIDLVDRPVPRAARYGRA